MEQTCLLDKALTRDSGRDNLSILVALHHSGTASMTTSQYDARIRRRVYTDSKDSLEGSRVVSVASSLSTDIEYNQHNWQDCAQ